ncbi:HEPN-associated N-terminal domain-containing protein [Cellvibrio sp. UBA7671]|uniref:HEPN-associated N-terminal domain-containing protein n=1 Tax=Cellvibrio sp. UBA7671 TaxID=1946312 RepID=UPI002F35C203
MGIAKSQMIEDWDRGFSSGSESTVCTNCFEDHGLKKFIAKHQSCSTCSYCENDEEEQVIACDFDTVLEYILSSITQNWTDPASAGVPYETAEGGYQLPTISTYELLLHINLEINSGDLFDDVCSAIHNQDWCTKDPYSLADHEVLISGWDNFCRFVKIKSRYFFLDAVNTEHNPNQHDEINPVAILDVLAKAINQLQWITTIAVDEEILRVRIVNPSDDFQTASDLGSPPLKYARLPNRMSPAGISMFYGAFDLETSIAETYQPSATEKKAICGVFKPVRPLTMIDLSRPFEVPTIFDEEGKKTRTKLQFLDDFIEDFTKPIDREDRAHIDYVPTQIVTEYFRHVFKTADGISCDGVIYPSSKSPGKRALVIFADSEQCSPREYQFYEPQMLELHRVESKVIPAY